jgi:hypothetical protein
MFPLVMAEHARASEIVIAAPISVECGVARGV